MGFRDPITTAEDPVARATANQALALAGTKLSADQINGRTITGGTFQTAPATTSQVPAAGASLQEAADADGFPYGALVFYDGISADAPSYVMGKADYNPRSEGSTLGGGLTIQAGKYNNVPGPSVQVKVESTTDGTGTVSPVVRINSAGGRVITDAPFDAVGSALVSLHTPFRDYPAAGLERLTVWKLASGLMFISGVVQNNGAATATGAVIGTMPTTFAPLGGTAILQSYVNGGQSCRIDVHTDGTLTLIEPSLTAGNYIAVRAFYRPDSPLTS